MTSQRLQDFYQKRFDNGDTTIEICKCKLYFVNEEFVNNDWKLYSECEKCRRLGTKTPKEIIGMMAPGDLEKLSTERFKEKSFIGKPKNTSFVPMKEKRNVAELIPNTEERKTNQAEDTMKRIENDKMKGENSILKKQQVPKRDDLKTGENIMNGEEKTLLNNAKSLKNADGETIPFTESNRLLTLLNEENKGSIQQLNHCAEQLISYAEQLAAPRTKDDIENGVIRSAPSHNIIEAAKCLEMARNAFKTKLDFLKFGKDLLK